MKKKIKGIEHLMNCKGDFVPVALINPADVERDELVERVFKKIERMKRLQEWVADEIDREIKEYLEKKSRNWESFSLTNYTGNKRIRYSFSEIIDFTEEIEIAKQKIYACIKKWRGTDEGGAYLEAVVRQAFGDKKINKVSLLKLLTVYIQDKEWIEAQSIIKNAIRVSETKHYREFAERSGKDKKFAAINLNFSTYGGGR